MHHNLVMQGYCLVVKVLADAGLLGIAMYLRLAVMLYSPARASLTMFRTVFSKILSITLPNSGSLTDTKVHPSVHCQTQQISYMH